MNCAARSKSHPDCNFARPVRRPRGEETAKIGAGSQQDEACQEHEPGHEGPCGPAEGISGKPRMRQGELQTVIRFGIGLWPAKPQWCSSPRWPRPV